MPIAWGHGLMPNWAQQLPAPFCPVQPRFGSCRASWLLPHTFSWCQSHSFLTGTLYMGGVPRLPPPLSDYIKSPRRGDTKHPVTTAGW